MCVTLSLYGWLLLFFLRGVRQHVPSGFLYPQRWLPDGSSRNAIWRTPHAPKPLAAGYGPQRRSQVLTPRSPTRSLHGPFQPDSPFQVRCLRRWCLSSFRLRAGRWRCFLSLERLETWAHGAGLGVLHTRCRDKVAPRLASPARCSVSRDGGPHLSACTCYLT